MKTKTLLFAALAAMSWTACTKDDGIKGPADTLKGMAPNMRKALNTGITTQLPGPLPTAGGARTAAEPIPREW